MSKTEKSTSRSRSRSGSRSRSRSYSRSRSRSRSRSHSRSRKHRYRSRSRSRSHSPPHNRERNYPREYQKNREFRGYHRGFRRPYYHRGRGRGLFRGRFQRGRGGGYNNYRSNNWQDFRQQAQQQQSKQQQQLSHSPRRGRSRSHSPKKHSESPQSCSHSRRSDRSSSGRSQPSCCSPNSPKEKFGSGAAKDSVSDVTEGAKENQNGEGGDEFLTDNANAAGPAEGQGSSGGDVRQVLTDNGTSPKRASPQICSAIIADQVHPATSEQKAIPKSTNASTNGTTKWQAIGNASFTKSPSKKSPTAVFSGFGSFTNVDQKPEDRRAISIAFKKFLEEHKSKKTTFELENGLDQDAHKDDIVCKLGRGKSETLNFEKSSDTGLADVAEHSNKNERENYKYFENFEGNMPASSFRNGPPPFISGDGKKEGDQEEMSHHKMRELEDDSPKWKSKATLSAQELFEEHLSKLDEMNWDDELEALLYRSKQERAAAIMASLTKKEMPGVLKGFSSEKPSKIKRREKISLSSSPSPPPQLWRSSENREPEMFMVMSDESPPRSSGKRGTEFNVRMDSLSNQMARSSSIFDDERIPRGLIQHKKEQEFRSIFQHIQGTQLRRSPSELFAQHIVTIVHQIKAQHFPSSGMTLNDRFAMYRRRAAEMESTKPRKSPEIHRRIDVSPSAFKKHSHLFEEMKSSMDSSNKAEGKKMKNDSVDLRLDIERRKKISSREGDNYKPDWGQHSEESPELRREQYTGKPSKHHRKSKKSKRKRARSHSSSSSTSSSSQSHEEAEAREEGFDKARLGPKEYGGTMEGGKPRGGFQCRVRGRGWNRGNYPGNNSNGMTMPDYLKNEDWDPEHTPKSKKYYLHDDRDGEGERKWTDARGRGRGNVPCVRGRFILRRPTSISTTNDSSPKWTHDKFQGSSEDADMADEDVDQDHKEENSLGVKINLKQ
ncbi:thyroid hormone receptor-associated protein 3 [Chanos chanos]|uniref:Thyroid hormone receptor-associated protein 3 n=1 Tax=Chanos chanos TaxID=29144 RepID=A0A6J2VYK7_CHACN|nr:thyroid hormone receptor-associated protein 3-like [Chanos chanos]